MSEREPMVEYVPVDWRGVAFFGIVCLIVIMVLEYWPPNLIQVKKNAQDIIMHDTVHEQSWVEHEKRHAAEFARLGDQFSSLVGKLNHNAGVINGQTNLLHRLLDHAKTTDKELSLHRGLIGDHLDMEGGEDAGSKTASDVDDIRRPVSADGEAGDSDGDSG